jgi:competence protein ComEC
VTARHHVLFSAVAGLLAGGWAAPVTPVVAAVAALLAPRRAVALGALVAVLAGAGLAVARRDAIDHGRVPARAGQPVQGEAVLLERFRTRASGERVAPARWRGGWADGERLLLRMDGAEAAPPAVAGARDRGDGAPASVAAAAPGAVLAVRGRVSDLRAFEVLQRRRGALAAVDVSHAAPTGGRRGGLAGAIDAARARAEAGLRTGMPDGEAALARGLVLGQDEAIAAEVREDFQASGLAHILAVSGTNVMLLCTLVLAAGALVGAPLRWRLGAALVLVALYVPLAGGSASIQRAGVMGAAGLVAALAGRATQRWYALGLAAAVTLALNPYAAGEPGWQLSFAAVVGLLALAPRLRERLRTRRWPPVVAEAAAMTVAATIATAPLLALHFDRVSIVSLPANLIAAPVVAPIMWLGMLAAAAAQVAPVLALPFNLVNGVLVSFLAWLAHVCARVPLAAVDVDAAPVLVLYGAAAVAWWQRRRLRALSRTWRASLPDPAAALRAHPGAAAALAAVCVLLVLSVSGGGGVDPPRPGETVVSFLDVGQGDATLIQRDGASMLVDTGPPGGPVVERLRQAGVRRLDVLLITHAQADHEGAAPEIVRRFHPRVVVNGGAGWPTRVQRMLPRAIVPAAGQTLRLGPMRLRILWPPRELMAAPPEGDPNQRAVVAHLRSGEFDLLLPADAESPVTAPLDLPRVEALKVAHHGSDDEGLARLLERLRPQVAAIEVGRGNSYGHPTPSTLRALEAVPRTYRTDRDGTVRLRVLGGRVSVERAGGEGLRRDVPWR